MTHGKNEASNLLPMTVSEGLTVNILPNEQFEYLMPSKEVALGYGVTEYNIRQHKLQHPDELKAGKHFIVAVSIPNSNLPHNAILWTKRGIVRLGFFIKSERAKLFRDWAEELIIQLDEQRDLFNNPVRQKQLAGSRKHNRLTQERMISILADVCRIDDRELRLSITNKLMKGGQA